MIAVMRSLGEEFWRDPEWRPLLTEEPTPLNSAVKGLKFSARLEEVVRERQHVVVRRQRFPVLRQQPARRCQCPGRQ